MHVQTKRTSGASLTVALVAGAVAAVAAVGGYLHERGRRQALELRVAELTAERDRLERDLVAARRRAARPADGTADGPSLVGVLTGLFGGAADGDTTDTADAEGTPQAEPRADRTASSNDPTDLLASLLAGPFVEKIQDSMVEMELGQMELALALDERERDEVRALLRRRARAGLDAGLAALGGGPDRDADPGAGLADEERELRRILGDRRYDEWRAAETRQREQLAEEMARSQMTSFAQQVGLTPEQAASVDPLLRAYGTAFDPAEMEAAVAGVGAAGALDSPRAVLEHALESRRRRGDELRDQLTAFLDAAQLARFDAWRRLQESQLEMALAFVPGAGAEPPR